VSAFLDRIDMRGALALVMVTSVMAMAFLLAVTHPDSDIFKMMLGTVVGASLTPAINWYFGSSSGSAMKDEALAKTATVQTATIAAQSDALANSVPASAAPTTTTSIDAKAGTAETVTAPAATDKDKPL
jgi:hypothetical protein